MRNHINESYKKSTRLLKAMAHPVRLAILDILMDNEEECVCHMEAMLGYRQAYLSQHLMSMREAGLVEDRREGRNIFYRISQPGMVSLLSNVRLLLEPQREVTLANPADCACPKCARGERSAVAENT